MLKTTSAVGPAENLEQVGQGIQMEDQGEKEPVQKSRKSQKTAKSKKWIRAKKAEASRAKNLGQSGSFLIANARRAFTELRQAFIGAPILNHYNPEHYIRIEMDASGYVMGRILSQLTSDDLGRWHPVAFFSRKMIPAETCYETHDGELLTIVEAFKTWRHYLEDCKHEVLVLTDHNNLERFMDTKSLSSRQVRWVQELSRYHFHIDYQQGKANEAADTLSQYPQRSAKEEETLRAENMKILHRLQSSLARVSELNVRNKQLVLSPLHQVLICETVVLPQLCQFWDTI